MRRVFTVIAAAAALALLAGCTGTSSAGRVAAPSASSSVTPAGGSPAPGEGAALPDPKSITGPSTAASVAEIAPVSKPPAPKLPVTVTDSKGRTATVTDASRILALDIYGTLSDTVVALGLGDRLVGRGSSNTLASMAKLPVVTQDGHDLNAEAILATHPTVLLTDTSIGPLAVQQQIAAAGIPVLFFDPGRSLADTGPQIEAVAHALGVDAAGVELSARVGAEIAAARTSIAAMAPKDPADRLRMVFLYVRGSGGVFFVLGKGSGADDLIEGLGGIDVASQAGISGIKPANAEALLAANPDLILVMTDGLASTGGLDGLLARPGVADTTAGRNRRVVDMADGQILSFGPTAAAVLRSLAHAVYEPGGSAR